MSPICLTYFEHYRELEDTLIKRNTFHVYVIECV